MEMFELRYFVSVASFENVNRAAEQINVSPGSLSKAIGRLEEELQTPLFFKSGRGIRLTPEGQILKRRATEILQLEEAAKIELKGKDSGSLNVSISSEEILQASFGLGLMRKLETLYPSARTQFLIRNEIKAVEQVRDGEAHLALTTLAPPNDLAAKVLAKVEFQTCASKEHPLFKKFSAKQSIPVEEILRHAFVSPDSAILGRIAKASSRDGWRDDKFPRLIKYKSCGLKMMENLIREGFALGYLPDHFIQRAGLVPLKVTGCPYSCQQTVRVVARDPSSLGWLSRLWDEL